MGAMNPTAFISSVIDGFEEYRAAAARGLTSAGANPMLVEDLPSLDRSPRNTCLDLVEDSDIYVVLVGTRGGWTAPSGMKVTEEEYEHAKASGKPILAFIHDGALDEDAARLAAKVSDYVDGQFRATFTSPDELAALVEQAVRRVIPRFDLPMRDHGEVQVRASEAEPFQREATLRVVAAPEREGELIDPLRLDEPELINAIYEIAHAPDLGLFSYEHAKKPELRGDVLKIVQEGGDHRRPRQFARLSITANGLIHVDLNVTGRRERGHEFSGINSLVIVEADVAAVARTAVRSVARLLDHLDPHKRHDRLLVQAALVGIQHRSWSRDDEPRNSYPMRMSDPNTVLALSEPRAISRRELPSLDERIVASLRRKLEE